MNNNSKKQLNKYLKYSGIGFQMIIVIFGGVYLGKFLDEKFHNENSLFSVITIMLAVCLSIFFAIKDFIFVKKK